LGSFGTLGKLADSEVLIMLLKNAAGFFIGVRKGNKMLGVFLTTVSIGDKVELNTHS